MLRFNSHCRQVVVSELLSIEVHKAPLAQTQVSFCESAGEGVPKTAENFRALATGGHVLLRPHQACRA